MFEIKKTNHETEELFAEYLYIQKSRECNMFDLHELEKRGLSQYDVEYVQENYNKLIKLYPLYMIYLVVVISSVGR